MKKSFTSMSLIMVIAVLSFLIVSATPVKSSPQNGRGKKLCILVL